jgi:trigger factor
LEITLEKKDVTNATLKVNLKQEDYQPKVSEKVKQYSKKATLKGFRPGKVPTSMIEKMYGKSILVDEINNLLSETISNYIRENKLPIIGDPLPNMDQSKKIDWDTQKEFEFNYEIGLVSDFSYDLSKNVKLRLIKSTLRKVL